MRARPPLARPLEVRARGARLRRRTGRVCHFSASLPRPGTSAVSTDGDLQPRLAKFWLWYAGWCDVQVLRCVFRLSLSLPDMTLVCQQLTKLQFWGVTLRDHTLDFSNCPVLDILEMDHCEISAEEILSQSLTYLSMVRCLFPLDVRTHISCPSLRDFKIVENVGLTPFLESMPSLVRAFVRFQEDTKYQHDHCYHGGYHEVCDDELCLACDYIDIEGNECVLLDGLSGAAQLAVIGTPEMIICTRDFKWRHMFSKLITLYLNDWCLAADFSGLVYFLQQSPILESLTLILEVYEQQPVDRKDETYKRRKQLLLSKNLKVVEIKHRNELRSHQFVDRLVSLVKILVSLGVPREHIKGLTEPCVV